MTTRRYYESAVRTGTRCSSSMGCSSTSTGEPEQGDASRIGRHSCRPDAPAHDHLGEDWCCSSARHDRTSARHRRRRNANRMALEAMIFAATRVATSSPKARDSRRGGEDLSAAPPGARRVEGRDLRLRLDRHPRLHPNRHSRRVREIDPCASHRAPSPIRRSRRPADRHPGPGPHRPGLGGERRAHRRPASAQHLLGDVGQSDVRHR